MNPTINLLKKNVEASIAAKQKLLQNTELHTAFSDAVDMIVKAYQEGGRLYLAGNGGSAADAQHLATEFVSKLARPRAPLPAEALTTDTSTITAIGNDYGFDLVFSRQIEGKMTKKDVFMGITTSGVSKNIVKALEVCRQKGFKSVVFSGRDGGPVKDLATVCVVAPGSDTSGIQETHIVLYHTLCACVEDAIFPNTK